jgi:hypothetical protein
VSLAEPYNPLIVENSGTVSLEAGKAYNVRLEYSETTRDAMVQLLWQPPGGQKQIIPANNFGQAVEISIPITTNIPAQVQVTEGLAPNDLGTPTVRLLGNEKINENANQTGVFRLQLSNPSKENLRISYTVGGNATLGQDYQELTSSRQVEIAAGNTIAELPLFPLIDSTTEGNETITLTLQPGQGYNLDNSNKTQTITLVDADKAGLQIGNVSFDPDSVDSNGKQIPLITSTLRTLQTSENGSSETIAIRLQSKPTADVKVQFDGLANQEGEIRLDQGQGDLVSNLTFTSNNWDQYQLLTVVGKPDQQVDGNKSYQIQARTISADANYQNLTALIGVSNNNVDTNVSGANTQQLDPTLPLVTIMGGNVTISETSGQTELQISLDKPAPQGGVYVLFTLEGSKALLNQDYNITNNTTYFNQITNSSDPLNGISVSRSSPAFGDLDKDGDLDLIVGKSDGTIKVFNNIGNSISPEFVELTETNNPFNSIGVGTNSTPVLADLDKDGDLDITIGTGGGEIQYYENISNSTGVKFGIRSGGNNPFDGIDVGDNSIPTLGDLDSDGDLDAIIGVKDGTIKYYQNTGTSSKPSFTVTTSTQDPFNLIDIGNNSSPNLADIDKDGDLDLFVGAADGKVYLYRNTGSSTQPSFTADTTGHPAQSWRVSNDSKPVIVDLDNDGNLDAVIGAGDGRLQYQKQLTAVFIWTISGYNC